MHPVSRDSEKPWFQRPVLVIATVIVCIGWVVLFDRFWPDALGATAQPDNARIMKLCSSDPEVACPNAPDGKDASRYTKKFNDGDYDNSGGQHFSDLVKKKIRNWYDNHPNAKARAKKKGNDDWWKFEFEQLACSPAFGAGYHVNCENGAEDRRVWDKYTMKGAKVVAKCSGVAIIASLASGGAELAAGAAGGTCFFEQVLDAWQINRPLPPVH